MKKNVWIAGVAAALAVLGAIPCYAGYWSQDTTQPENQGGVSNWRWIEDDGISSPKRCEVWLDGNQDGVYEHYSFDADGWMLAGTENEYGIRVNDQGAALSKAGEVMRMITPGDSALIATEDYLLTLPDNWKNRFAYTLNNGNLYVDFLPLKRVSIDGALYSSVSQPAFYILRFDSREEMDKAREFGGYDGWKVLGERSGRYYVTCGPTDTAIGFYTEEEQAVIRQLQESLSADQGGLWGRMAFAAE